MVHSDLQPCLNLDQEHWKDVLPSIKINYRKVPYQDKSIFLSKSGNLDFIVIAWKAAGVFLFPQWTAPSWGYAVK
jgi:hypothetical protein